MSFLHYFHAVISNHLSVKAKNMLNTGLTVYHVFFVFYLLLRRSISDHYLRSCGYVNCSRPQQKATGGLKPGISRPKVLDFTTAPVRSTCCNALYMKENIGILYLHQRDFSHQPLVWRGGNCSHTVADQMVHGG